MLVNQDNSFEVKRLWNGTYIILSIINILMNLGFSMVTTTISVYTVSLGASLSVAGTVASLFSLAALMVRPVSGWFVDKYNKKNVFVISTILFGAVSFGYAFAKNVPLLFALRILHGILFGVSTTCTTALVSRFIPKDRIGEGLGYFNAGVMVGQAFGPAIGVAIKDLIGFSWLYVIVGVCICLPPFLCLFTHMPDELVLPVPHTANENRKFKFSFNDFIAKQFILYALVCGVFSFYNGVTNAFMLFVGDSRGIGNISLFFTVCSAVLLAVRILIGRFSDKGSLTVFVNCALVFTAVSMFSVDMAKSLLPIICAAVFKALGQGIGYIALQGEALKRAEKNRVGVATGTMYIGNDIGNTLGPIIGGLISQFAGYAAVFYDSMILVGVAMLAFNLYQKKIGYQRSNVDA